MICYQVPREETSINLTTLLVNRSIFSRFVQFDTTINTNKFWAKFEPFLLFTTYTGLPRHNGTVDAVDNTGLCYNHQLFSVTFCRTRASISHYNNQLDHQIWLSTFYLIRHYLWTVIFVICPISRVSRHDDKLMCKSQKWQSIRNYS